MNDKVTLDEVVLALAILYACYCDEHCAQVAADSVQISLRIKEALDNLMEVYDKWLG